MTLYTKTGDDGTTTLFGGERVDKTDARIDAYGHVDELVAQLGLLKVMAAEMRTEEVTLIERLQHLLLSLAWHLFQCQDSQAPDVHYGKVTTEMEQYIDRATPLLPELHNFVLPGSNQPEAQCHICRAVARRAERAVVAVLGKNATHLGHSHNADALCFMNRLSDFLFVFARKLTFVTRQQEKTWDKTCR